MSRKYKIKRKKPLSANKVSRSHHKTKKWQKPNLHYKKIFDPDSGTRIRIKVSARALRSISKLGLPEFLRKKGFFQEPDSICERSH